MCPEQVTKNSRSKTNGASVLDLRRPMATPVTSWAVPDYLQKPGEPFLEILRIGPSEGGKLPEPSEVVSEQEAGELKLRLYEGGELDIEGAFRGQGKSLPQSVVESLLFDRAKIAKLPAAIWKGWHMGESVDTRLQRISREEILPASIAWRLGMLSVPVKRGTDPYDVATAPDQLAGFTDLSLKTLTSWGTLIGGSTCRRLRALAKLEIALRNQPFSGLLLTVMPEVEISRVHELLQTLTKQGVEPERVVTFQAGILKLAGYGLIEKEGTLRHLPGDYCQGMRFRLAVALLESPIAEILKSSDENIGATLKSTGISRLAKSILSALKLAEHMNPARKIPLLYTDLSSTDRPHFSTY